MRTIITEVWGDFALFTRPELKTERVSYPVITPSAARGILSSVFWKPEIRHVIDRLHIINEPEYIDVLRNEIKSKIQKGKVKKILQNPDDIELDCYMYTGELRERRNSKILKNVRYVIESHIEVKEWTKEKENKYYAMMFRRLKKGQYFKAPYLGCKEFIANIKLIEDSEHIAKSAIKGEKNLGYMLCDMDFSSDEDKDYQVDNIKPMFFEAIINDGIIDLRDVKLVM